MGRKLGMRRRSRVAIVAASAMAAVPVVLAAPAAALSLQRVDLTATAYAGGENAGTVSVVLRRTSSLFGTPSGSGSSSVHVRTVGGTAIAGTDFTPVDTTVTFASGQTQRILPIALVGDGTFEPDESFTVQLGPEVSGADLGTNRSATVTIHSDDPAPTLAVTTTEAAVEGSDLVFTAQLSAVSGVDASFSWHLQDGTAKAGEDFVAVAGHTTIPAGQTTAAIRVPTLDDAAVEPALEDLVLVLGDPTNVQLPDGFARGQIADNDEPLLLSVDDAPSATEGDAAVFTVSLNHASTERVEFDAVTADGTATAPLDYTARSNRVAIDVGQTTVTVAVPTADDAVVEPSETFSLSLWNASGAQIADGTGVGTIVDAPPLPTLSVADAQPVSEGGVASFALTLSAARSVPVTVAWTTADGTATAPGDYAAAGGTVTFQPGETTKLLAVPTTNDAAREGSETFAVALASPTGSRIADGSATATIEDDDTCGAVSFPHDLNQILNALPPDGDADGDGFTNSQELGPLAFDPLADPARFNPLIADVPQIDVHVNGDLAIALYDSIDTTQQLGEVRIAEGERTDSRTDTSTNSTTESRTVGFKAEVGWGSFSLGASYETTRSTTNEEALAIGAETRELHRDEVQEILSTGHSIGKGSLAVTVTLRNTGHVSYRIEDIGLILRSRGSDGSLFAFDTLHPDFAFGFGPTLGPGQTKDVLFTIDDIGATDALALARDASELVIGVGGGFELSQIGAGPYQVGTLNFARYLDTIRQNTAALTLDYGPGRPNATYLVSTTYARDADGRPVGTSLCDAVQIMLGRDVEVSGPTELTVDGTTRVVSVLTGLGTGGPLSTTIRRSDALNASWIMSASPEAVGGQDSFDLADIHLRAGYASELVLFQDTDHDALERRRETEIGASDTDTDSDDDGLLDGEELLTGWQVITERADAPPPYRTISDPTTADTDGDGLLDPAEKSLATDAYAPDTDGDALVDGADPRPTVRTSFAHYTFDDGTPAPANGGGQPSLDMCRIDGQREPTTDRHGNATGAFTAAWTIVDGCQVIHRSAAPQLASGWSVTGWFRGTDPGTGTRRTYLVGQPGGIALAWDEGFADVDPQSSSNWTFLHAMAAPCEGTTCPPPLPDPADRFELLSGAGTPAAFSRSYDVVWDADGFDYDGWHFFALTVRPEVTNGASGTLFHVQLDDRAVDTFQPGVDLSTAPPCVLAVAGLTTSCTGVVNPAQMSSLPPELRGIDDVQLFNFALSWEQLARVRTENH